MPETRSLHRKLAQVMYEAERIPKNGTAPAAMGGFKFVQVGDAADVIRRALAEQKISMIPTAIELVSEAEHRTANDKAMTTVTVRTTWTLTDGDSGESIVIQSMGSGADTGDKAIPKAQSNAMKYALLMGFLLSTGDDPEQTDTSDRRSRNEVYGASNPPPPRTAPVEHDGLIGVAEKTDKMTSDFNLRQTKEGWFLGFRLKDGTRRNGILVEALGELAEDLKLIEDKVLGQRVQVWGHWVTHRIEAKNADYDAFRINRISGPDFALPSDPAQEAPEGPSETEVAGPSSPAGPAAILDDDPELAALPMWQEPAA